MEGTLKDDVRSQMPIGKYIYCTRPYDRGRTRPRRGHKCLSASTFTVPNRGEQEILQKIFVTNAYRQVHLLYQQIVILTNVRAIVTNAYRQVHLLYHKDRVCYAPDP